jgi:hypothetical protein
MTAYFYRPLRIFPQELHSPHTRSGKNADETAFLATPDSGFGLLVVLMTSVGFADGLPLVYFQRLNVAIISVALPIVGMILFTAILLGLSGRPAEAVKPAVIDGAVNLPMSEEVRMEEHLANAA